jgi:hypothetical protein
MDQLSICKNLVHIKAVKGELMRFILTAFTLLAFNFSFADEGLNNLRHSFNPFVSEYVKSLDIAAAIKPIESKLGDQISFSRCQSVAQNIRAASKIDPFEFVYEGGGVVTKMCGGEYGWRPNYISNQTGKTKFNIAYNMIVQLKHSDENDKRLDYSNYYINTAYQIVQIEHLSYDVSGNLGEFQVTTKDEKGNFFINYYIPKMGYPQKNITGSTSIQTWIPNDGSVSGKIMRNRIVDIQDSKKSYQTLIFTKTDKKDFEAFELPITHSWSGGFFVYSGKYYHNPNFYRTLFIEFKDDKEVCSWGSITAEGKWQSYPVDQNEYYKCVNF